MVRLLAGGRTIKVEPHSWTLMEDDRKKAEVVQLPLRLAWAITIHKSQGMSLDAAEIDLSKSFTPGMGYVALSRVRSLAGIYLTGVNQMALQLNPTIYEFDRQLQKASATLAEITEDVADEAPASESKSQATEYDQELFDTLRVWRLERARTEKVAPFMIAHDSTLQELARRKPTSMRQLLATKGFGPKKAESYGDDIVKLINGSADPNGEQATGWNAEDDAELIRRFKAGESLQDLTKHFDATTEELWQHLSTIL